jgi:hypothetical protein
MGVEHVFPGRFARFLNEIVETFDVFDNVEGLKM